MKKKNKTNPQKENLKITKKEEEEEEEERKRRATCWPGKQKLLKKVNVIIFSIK